jgi:hypothetical protein
LLLLQQLKKINGYSPEGDSILIKPLGLAGAKERPVLIMARGALFCGFYHKIRMKSNIFNQPKD